MTKVLHIHSGNLYGGVETFLLTLARSRHLAPSMEMSVALCFEDRIAAELRGEGIPTSILGAVRLRRPDTVWRARQALRELLRRSGFEVAVCHQAWPLAIFGAVVKAVDVPLVSWIHMAHGRHWIDRLASRVEPDLIVCNSKFTAYTLPPTSARVEVAYPPVLGATDARRATGARGAAGARDAAGARGAAGAFGASGSPADSSAVAASDAQAEARSAKADAIRDELNTPISDAVIIQVSRMEAWKGQTTCLEALARLRERSGWTCWQVGGAQRRVEERYMASLRENAGRLGISDRVRFLGQRSDVPQLLAAADIFCQPNHLPEPFGISFIEALSAGLPVVTSDFGGALEIVNGTCGRLVPSHDSEALAAELLRLIGDRSERETLGNAGRQRAQALCDPARQTRLIADLLESVCRQRVH